MYKLPKDLNVSGIIKDYEENITRYLFDENERLNAIIDEYEEMIDKAIEWVNNIQQDKDNKHLEPYIATDTLDELLEILGGEEQWHVKEEKAKEEDK